MEQKKSLNFGFLILAFIFANGIYRAFDFEKKQFENNALAILYMVLLLVSIAFLVKDFRKPPKNNPEA